MADFRKKLQSTVQHSVDDTVLSARTSAAVGRAWGSTSQHCFIVSYISGAQCAGIGSRYLPTLLRSEST